MYTTGYDIYSGYGLIQADTALKTMANPIPNVTRMELMDSSLTPGLDPVEVNIYGKYFSSMIQYLQHLLTQQHYRLIFLHS